MDTHVPSAPPESTPAGSTLLESTSWTRSGPVPPEPPAGSTPAPLDVADGRPPAFPFARFRQLRFGGRPHCPHCDGARVQRWGGFAGRRRYRCVACTRTFSDFTGTPLATLKRIECWPAFCHCMRQSLSVRRTARRLGVDKDTAFRWRHRLLGALRAADTRPLGATVTFHETWFAFSEKGQRVRDRPARRRAAFRRVDMTPVWVTVARDETGRTASAVVGLHRPSATDLAACLAPRLSRSAELVSATGPYGAPGVLAVRLEVRYRRADPRSPEVRAVRRYTLALRRWIARFRGVATRYLAHYLAWHRFLARDVCVPGDVMARSLLAARFP